MDVYILEYPLFNVTEDSGATMQEERAVDLDSGESKGKHTKTRHIPASFPTNATPTAETPAQADDKSITPSDRSASSLQNRNMAHNLNHTPNANIFENEKSTASKNKGDGVIGNKNNQSQSSDSEALVPVLNRQIKSLELRLERQQKCFRKHEIKLKALYEEEIDVIEDDYRKTLLNVIYEKHNYTRTTFSLSEQLPKGVVPSISHGTQVDIHVGSCNCSKQSINPFAKVTVNKGCNTEPTLVTDSTSQSPSEMGDLKNSSMPDPEEILPDTEELFNKLSSLVHRFNKCASFINNTPNDKDKDEIATANPPSSRASVHSVKTVSKSKRRRYKKRQRFNETIKSPRKFQSTSTNVASGEISVLESPRREVSKSGSMIHTTLPPCLPTPFIITTRAEQNNASGGDYPTPDDNQGWQTVRSRRNVQQLKRAAALNKLNSQTEAGTIAQAINAVPKRYAQINRSAQFSAKPTKRNSKVDPCSYSGKLQLGKSSHKNSDLTINSDIPTLSTVD